MIRRQFRWIFTSGALVAIACGTEGAVTEVNDPGQPSPAAVASVEVSPSSLSIQPGESVQLTATAKDAAGNVVTGNTVTWNSTNPSVATVTSGGMVIGASDGSTTVTASVQAETGSVGVTVQTPPFPTVPLFYSTLDDANSVMNPVNGAASAAQIQSTPANDFVPAQVAMGFHADELGERILIPQMSGGTQNVELEKGTIEFWYQPQYDHTDDNKYSIIGNGDWWSLGSWHLGKHNNSNNNDIFFHFFAPPGTTMYTMEVAVADYSWSAGQWIKMRLTWDWTVAPGVENVHLYLDDVEVPMTSEGGPPTTGPYTMPAESTSRNMWIGSRDDIGNIVPDGIYDELRIWHTVIPAN